MSVSREIYELFDKYGKMLAAQPYPLGAEARLILDTEHGVYGTKKNVNLGNPAPTNQKKVQISLILGIIGIVSAWLYALGGHILSIIGIVFGVKEYKETGNMIGLVLSIIGEVCSVISSLIGIIMVFQYL